MRSTAARLARRQVAAWLAVALLAACQSGGPERPAQRAPAIADPPAQAAGEPPRSGRVVAVVATTSVLGDWARVVGGVNVRVHVMVKAGIDPLAYQPTGPDIDSLRRAELVLAAGPAEPWLGEARAAAGGAARLVETGAGLPERRTPSGAIDPFAWLDPANARTMVAAVVAALAEVDPADAPAFRFAGERYLQRLDAAAAEAERVLVPVRGRPVVTAKESMGWFAGRYGIEVAGTIVPSPDGRVAPTPEHLTALRQVIQARQVRAVFGEASVPAAPVRALARETGVKALVGDDGLFGDGLGPAGSAADTYLGLLDHNARVLAAHA